MREWVPASHLVHFVMDAVSELDVKSAKVNERGTGDAQYPPAMMLGLLIYSYATGVFSSRKIERATYENVAVRVMCADTHPDHDTICAFRRGNPELLSASFAQVLELAARCGVLRVGGITVALDGTKVLANASKHASGRAGERASRCGPSIGRSSNCCARPRRPTARRWRTGFPSRRKCSGGPSVRPSWPPREPRWRCARRLGSQRRKPLMKASWRRAKNSAKPGKSQGAGSRVRRRTSRGAKTRSTSRIPRAGS
ncbi:hypothetical protein BH09VER1_BH09VER1_53740 [soil metagenome]